MERTPQNLDSRKRTSLTQRGVRVVAGAAALGGAFVGAGVATSLDSDSTPKNDPNAVVHYRAGFGDTAYGIADKAKSGDPREFSDELYDQISSDGTPLQPGELVRVPKREVTDEKFFDDPNVVTAAELARQEQVEQAGQELPH